MGSAYRNAGDSRWISFCRAGDAAILTNCYRCPTTSQSGTKSTGATNAFSGKHRCGKSPVSGMGGND